MSFAGLSYRNLLAQLWAYQMPTAMAAETRAVTSGSAHCGGKCDGCAKMSPIKVANALIVACRVAEFNFRSICASSATLTAAPTVPHMDASRAWSRVRAFAKSPRAMTRKQANHAPANFSIAGRASPPAGSLSCKMLRKPTLCIGSPLLLPPRFAIIRYSIQSNSPSRAIKLG